jgi:hypothetical protein
MKNKKKTLCSALLLSFFAISPSIYKLSARRPSQLPLRIPKSRQKSSWCLAEQPCSIGNRINGIYYPLNSLKYNKEFRLVTARKGPIRLIPPADRPFTASTVSKNFHACMQAVCQIALRRSCVSDASKVRTDEINDLFCSVSSVILCGKLKKLFKANLNLHCWDRGPSGRVDIQDLFSIGEYRLKTTILIRVFPSDNVTPHLQVAGQQVIRISTIYLTLIPR